jgi:hypothetical protein
VNLDQIIRSIAEKTMYLDGDAGRSSEIKVSQSEGLLQMQKTGL